MSGQSKIRAFVAVHLPQMVKAELALVNDVLAGQVPAGSVRWVQPDLLHLTLRFLGETAVADLPTLMTTLDDVAAQHAPFTLHLDNLGCFPNRSRPRTLWVGLAGDVTAVQNLQADVETAVTTLGWPRENKPFRVHLTLGRVKDGRLLQNAIWGAEVKKLAAPVTAVHLVESQLHPSGPVYTVRHTSRLRHP